MLDVTRLINPSSPEAASVAGRERPASSSRPIKPVVTWRVTRFCNLNCRHCSTDSRARRPGSELSTREGIALIGDLAQLGVPRLVFAGGEPLLRGDLVELVSCAHEHGIQTGLLTNGTVLTLSNATALKRAGLGLVSIQLEGIGREVDRHRGSPGSYNAILDAYANCAAAGLDAEVRVLMTRWNCHETADILDFIERQDIGRVVFAHVVGGAIGYSLDDDVGHAEKRHAIDLIFDRAEDFQRRGVKIAVGTDHNNVDGIHLYLRIIRADAKRAAGVYRSVQASSAVVQGSGVGGAGIDSMGDVYPDAYWTSQLLGNVRETPFSENWESSSHPLLRGLRDRLPLLKGKCAKCRWQEACGGNSRHRAEEYFGDPWMADPACYLTNDEIAKDSADHADAMEEDVLLPEQAA